MFAGHLGDLELAGSTLANFWAFVSRFACVVEEVETWKGEGVENAETWKRGAEAAESWNRERERLMRCEKSYLPYESTDNKDKMIVQDITHQKMEISVNMQNTGHLQ
ncbi:hypothetical protein AMTR_s00032p00229390 [Amborella trichopoda]|uniref:Uncharacterized protein n=1 Tax=Amborella trichopoda TaxID=13333 RepID=U5D3R7_AMBTC|nr:hypothetical protein AMTR_s00032p00229390 [Amborella trichopoda]